MTRHTINHAIQPKPRLVLFQYRYDPRLPSFLSMHAREHAKCLSNFFEVTVIDKDCEYQEICERYMPDVVVFESGVPFASCHKPTIANVKSCAHVPKIGLLNADAFGEGRAGFLSDMDHWGIETFFAIATTAAEHIPEIANNLFIWPNAVDADLYRDYGQSKNIPVLFTGNANALYPWRQQITRLVSRHYPSLICPHPGYSPLEEVNQLMVGEPYARMLNASYFVPACGTVVREVVRKHFEVPACRSCLVTQQSAGLEAAGFADMVNCIFAEEGDVLEKLAFLFSHPERLQAITDAGYNLVRSRHTSHQRDQILQWLTLSRTLAPNSKIVQSNPFGPLEVIRDGAEATEAMSAVRPPSGSLLEILGHGDAKLANCKYSAAETIYLRCVNHYRFMPEPQMRLALCNLYLGNAKAALGWITKPIQFTLAEYKAIDPDPVEWSYFIITLLCLGRTEEAVERAAQFPYLHHGELDRVRSLIAFIRNGAGLEVSDRIPADNLRRSVHRLPERNFKEWTRQLSLMLIACGRGSLARRVMQFRPLEANESTRITPTISGRTGGATYVPGMEKRSAAAFKKRFRYQQKRVALKRLVKKLFYRVEASYRDFLPSWLARYSSDTLSRAIQDRAHDETFRTALIIGAAPSAMSTQVLAAAAKTARGKLSIFGISARKPHSKSRAGQAFAHWYQLQSTSPGLLAEELNQVIQDIGRAHHVDQYDMVIIDGSELETQLEETTVFQRLLEDAICVVLDDVNGRTNHATYTRLTEDPRFLLVDCDFKKNGYAIFERSGSADGFGELSAVSSAAGSDTEGIRAVQKGRG